jgi:hypothetical protein
MTRAFTPPETLSKEDIRKVADVRRDIWTSAFWGMGVGSLSCLALHGVAQLASRRGMLKGVTLNRNTALLSFLAGGSFGSFLMASTTGKNEVHRLHPVFEVGSKQEYEQSLIRAQQRESELKQMEHGRLARRASQDGTHYSAEEERAMRERNRMLRRKTLQDNIQHGRGQTDSHGGRWSREDERFQGQVVFVDPDEERALRQKNRMLRRKTLQDTIEYGRK